LEDQKAMPLRADVTNESVSRISSAALALERLTMLNGPCRSRDTSGGASSKACNH